MSESGGNSTARPSDPPAVLRVWALVLLVAAVLPVSDTLRALLGSAPGAAAVARAAGRREATLRGAVKDEDGAPVRGARVLAVLVRDGLSWHVADVRTDAQGRFSTGAIPPGEVQLVVTAAGRTRALIRLPVEGDAVAPTLVLAPSNRIEGVVSERRGAALAPLAGAVVRAVSEGSDGAWPFVARTDANGRYTLDGLPAGGTWRVELDAPGHERTRRIGVLAPSASLSLVARALATLEGVVRDAHGEPAPTARVSISGSGIWPSRSVPLLHDGRFLISDVPAGVYELRASRDDDVADPLAPLILEPGGREEVSMRLAPGGAVSGVVRDAISGGGVAGARVVVTEDALSMAPHALRTDEGGRFALRGLVRRPHRVAVYAPGYAPLQGALALADAPLDLRLDRGVTVDGRLVDARGAPIRNARVELLSEDLDGHAVWWNGATVAFRDALFSEQARGPRPLEPRGELGVTRGRVPLVPLEAVPMGVEAERTTPGWTTDDDGRFHLIDVPPGVIRVGVSHVAYVRAQSDPQTVRPGETVNLELIAHEGGAVEGRVLTDRGFPMSGVQVELRAEREVAPRRVFTSRDGSFRAASLLGRTTLVAWVQGRVAARAETEVADGAVQVVNLTVPGSLRRVEGRVLDARGFPVAGATISITSLERAALGTVQTFSEADGTFDTVIGGTRGVSIEVRHPEHAPRGLRVENLSRPVRVELVEGAALVARVEDDGCATGPGRAELRTTCGPSRVPLVEGEPARFERLCPGRATLVIEAPGCLDVQRALQIPASGEVSLGRVELRGGGGATGEVLDGDGDVVAGAVIAREGDEGGLTARSGRRGEFTIAPLPEGDVGLVATHPSLGTSLTARVRILRGTTARGVLLRMQRTVRDGSRVVPTESVTLEEGGARGEVLVRSVAANSTAERAGVRPGDRVVSAGAAAVRSLRDAERRMTGPPGDDVVLELERDGQRRTVRFVRESR